MAWNQSLLSCPSLVDLFRQSSRCRKITFLLLFVPLSAALVNALLDVPVTRRFGLRQTIAFSGCNPVRPFPTGLESTGINIRNVHDPRRRVILQEIADSLDTSQISIKCIRCTTNTKQIADCVALPITDKERNWGMNSPAITDQERNWGMNRAVRRTSNTLVKKNRACKSKRNPNRLSPRIIIIGGPASGKGTQCEFIASNYGVVHLSTGDMLREAVKKTGSEIGKVVKSYIEAGELVPDDLMIKIVNDRLNRGECQERGWILDGFPRTKEQAEHLLALGFKPDLILFLNVPDTILIERVVGRRLDPHTGKIYHVDFCPPPQDILYRLEQRSDDTLEVIQRRLEHFHRNVSEIRSCFEDKFIEVDGTRSPHDISYQISKAILYQKGKNLIQASRTYRQQEMQILQ